MNGRPTARGIRLCRDEAGVTDVLGSILLVGMTVVMAAGLGALLLSLDGPSDLQHTDFAVTVDPGADGRWQGEPGDADSEQVRIAHIGGEHLRADTVRATLRVGATTIALTGTDLAQSSGTGTDLRLGEVWTSNQSIARNTTVSLDLVHRPGSNRGQVLTSSTTVAGTQAASVICSADTTPPVAATPFTQSPPDLTTASSGPVNVTAFVTDNCSGVNAASPPQLWSCVAASCTFPGGYTNHGAMSGSGGVWSGTIPRAGSWASEVGKTLHYRVVGMTDVAGNKANSSIQTDPIDLFTTYRYVDAVVATTGTVANLNYAQNATDALEATISEGQAPGTSTGSVTLAGQGSGVTTLLSGWSSASNGAGSDDVHATNSNDGRTITMPLADPVGQPGTITQVVVRAEVSIAGANGDRFEISACISGTCNTPLAVVGNALDTVISYDVTSLRPGGGAWTWADIANLQTRLVTARSGAVDGTWRIDDMDATVSYQASFSTSIQANFTAVPAGNQSLQVSYRNSGDTFRLEACTAFSGSCTAWTALGSLPNNAGTTTPASFTLPGAAYMSGSVRIRVLDNTLSTTSGLLYVDYLRVATT